MTFAKKAVFRDWLSTVGSVGQGERLTISSGFLCIYGTSEFLLNHTVDLVRRHAAERLSLPITALEASSLDAASFANLLGQKSLFDVATVYIVRRAESLKTLSALLKAVKSNDSTANLIAFCHKGEALLAPVKAELERLKASVIPCFDPYANEVPATLRQLARGRGLNLAAGAADLLIEATGTDLTRLDHELEKLALIFAGEAGHSGELSAAAVAPHLGMLREDDAFQLDRLLLARQTAKAHALAGSLLRRGEKGLALLGILATHCRNALRCIECMAKGISAAELPAAVRLPPFIAKNYVQALRGADPKRYAICLTRIQEADVFLKTSRMSEDTCLAYVLEALA